jgi:hypothetical protein
MVLVYRHRWTGTETFHRHLTLTNPDYVKEYLVVGACFDIMEGPRKIGDGSLLSIPAMLQEKEVSTQPERG